MQDKDAQALLYEYEILEKKFEELTMLRENLKAVFKEYRAVKHSLKELINKKSNEVLLPLGGGYYVKTTVSSDENIFVSIGGGIVVEKKFEDALKKVEEEELKVKEEIKKIDEERKKIKKQLKSLAGLFS
ncbi:MAG: prefoldin subunit alpha [Candidatus Nanohaloarchaeota archaeon]|nr:prefoldin subunit alpha [Candidatus Nanohaloarchaeota archaeon]